MRRLSQALLDAHAILLKFSWGGYISIMSWVDTTLHSVTNFIYFTWQPNFTQWIGPQAKWRIPRQSTSDVWRLTISTYGQIHRGHVHYFLMFWLEIAIVTVALFHHSVCDHLCFTVMFHCDVSQMRWRIPKRTEHIFIIWSGNRVKSTVSREQKKTFKTQPILQSC